MGDTSVLDRPAGAPAPAGEPAPSGGPAPAPLRQILTDPVLLRIAALAAVIAALLVAIAVIL